MIPDERLQLALEEYGAAITTALPEPSECSHLFSKKFDRKMRGVCRRAKHPMAYKALQRAACILLVMLALFAGVIAFHAEAREVIINWFKEEYGQFYKYFFEDKNTSAQTERKHYVPGWLPEGYVLTDTLISESDESLVYVNESGCILSFICCYNTTNGLYVNAKDYTIETVLLDACTAEMYLTEYPHKNNGIVFAAPEDNVLFCISAHLNEEDLIRLANSILEIE